jgi:putative ATP-dependent endonuclease of the OLD family
MLRGVVIRQLRLQRFRGFEDATIRPSGHVALIGEPRAGRSDVIEALRRVLSPDSTRAPITDDLDFYQRDRVFRPEVEVVLGALGPALTQQFFDRLEFWDAGASELVDELDHADPLNDPALEPVVRLCYRAQWSDNEEVAHHWVDYAKTSDPSADDFDRVRRADRAALPFFVAGPDIRPLSLTARAILRRLVDEAHGGDFVTHLEELLEDVRAAAEGFGQSQQIRTALESVVAPARPPLDAEIPDVNDLLRFAPEGGVMGSILRSLSPTLDLSDGAGFIPLSRHGSTVTALFALCELIAIGGAGVVTIDDFGENLDSEGAHHLTTLLRQQAGQAWLSTRRAAVAGAFRPAEVIRFGFTDSGARNVFAGWEAADKSERMFARHFALQVLPAMTARALIVLEGPHDRAGYSAVAERLFEEGSSSLPAAKRIALADVGATDASGGVSAIPKLAAGARRLGFFTVAVIDGDKDQTAVQDVVDAADLVIRLPEKCAIERALVDGVDDASIRQAFDQLDVASPNELDALATDDLQKRAVALLKQRGGVHGQFVDSLPPGVTPPLAKRILERAVAGVIQRERGLVQL